MKKFINICKQNKKNIIIFSIIFLITLFFLYLYHPGILTYDSSIQWEEVLNDKVSNAHPFLSTYFMYLLSKIYKSTDIVILYQIILSSFTITRIFNILRKDNTKFYKEIIACVFICVFPLVCIYTITLWKDIIYSYYLLNIVISLYKWKNNNNEFKIYDYIILSILFFAVFNYRINGMIVVPLIILYMIISMKKTKTKKVNYAYLILPFIILNLILLIPKNYYLSKIEKTEEINIGSLNSYMVWIFGEYLHDEVKISEKDKKTLNNIANIEEWKNKYNGYLINYTTLMPINKKYLLENQNKFRNIFIKTTLRNPVSFIKHYVKADSLMLIPYINSDIYSFDYVGWQQNKNVGNLEFISSNYQKLVSFTTENKITGLIYRPANVLYLSIILVYIINKLEKTKKYYIILLPMLANTISLIPINIAQDLRYVYINYLTFIFIIILYLNKIERKKQ